MLGESENQISDLTGVDETRSDQLLIRYTEGGGFDIYEEGDRYGYALEIYFSGKFKVFKRIYTATDDGSQIREEEINSGNLDPELISELQDMLEDTGFFGFPERLPDGSPHDIEMRTPSENIILIARRSADDKPYTVRANLGAERRHFPEHFFELRSKLRQLLTELQGREN